MITKQKSEPEYPIYSKIGKLFCMRKINEQGEVILESKTCSLTLMDLQSQALNPSIQTLKRCKGNRKRISKPTKPRQPCDMATDDYRSDSTEEQFVQAPEPNHIE